METNGLGCWQTATEHRASTNPLDVSPASANTVVALLGEEDVLFFLSCWDCQLLKVVNKDGATVAIVE